MNTLVSRLVFASFFVLVAGARDNGCLGGSGGDDGSTTTPDAGQVCPALACRMNCGPAGLVRDENGCDTCACNAPIACWADADCPTGAVCDRENYCEQAPGGCGGSEPCPPVCAGRCVAAPTGCHSDTDCAADEFCSMPQCDPSIAPCGATGVCEPRVTGRCDGAWLDENGNCRGPADGTLPPECCGQESSCDDGYAACDALPPTCPAPLVAAVHGGCYACVDPADCAVSCETDAQCGAGETCTERIYDPCGKCDPANGQPCCASPAYQYRVCTKAETCTTDADCAGGLACRPDPTDPCNQPGIDCFRAGRSTCQKPEPTCDAVMCDLYCEYGFQKDANGCDTCSCNPAPCESRACQNACPNGYVTDPNGCATCDCAPDPSCICTEEYAPVCGSDGRTYGNSCEAACAHATVAAPGECGSCTIECLVYQPVCGADGNTYGCGEADAACHGTTVVHDGECTAGCTGDGDCAPGQKCYGAVVPRPGTMPPSTQGRCVAVDFCETTDDCTSLAPTIACVGTWSCASNRCAYTCSH